VRSAPQASKAITTAAGSRPLARARRSLAFWRPLARLAPSRAGRRRFWITTLELTLRHKLSRPLRGRSARTVLLDANGVGVAFAVGDIGELHGLREVFVQGDYALQVPCDPEVILDLGGNIGAAAVYFATRWPPAAIVVLEPDPDAFGRLVRNTRRFPRVTLLRLAAAARAGEATLYRTGYTLTSSLVDARPGAEALPVQAVTLDWLLDGPCGGRIDLLKFDIEGAELEVMRSCARHDRIPALVGELHPRLMGAPVEEFAGMFAGHRVEIEDLPNGELVFRASRPGC
jgi:FkbM family methyltransferase